MLAEERRIRIREMLATHKTVAAAELAASFSVAMATVRRDLVVLEREGVLLRSHGGAVSRASSSDFQLSFEVLQKTSRAEKMAMAAVVQPLISDGEIVFLEGSTTVLEVAALLRRYARLTIVTNSPPILDALQGGTGLTLMSTGGELEKDLRYLCGPWTRDVLLHTRMDYAVIGISAIDTAYGISTTRPAHAEIKQLLARSAKKRIGLADHTKFGKQAFAFVGPVTELDVVVTSSLTSPDHVEALRSAGVEVLVAPMPAQRAEADRTEQ
jgi:DeoR/GlpR family transcriptional regulator of sugar metabolism